MNLKQVYYYTAGPIEHADLDKDKTWKEQLIEGLNAPEVYPYDPVKCESLKTKKTSKEMCEYIRNLKKAGHYKMFDAQMSFIWWGALNPKDRKVPVLLDYRNRAIMNKIIPDEFKHLGDFTAVASSEFIVAYLPKGVRTVGTYSEITLAYLLGIPVYLILPDSTKVDTNSTLLYLTRSSLGGILYSVKDAIQVIRENHIDNRIV